MEQDVYRLVYELEERHWWFRGRRAVIDALLSHRPAAQPRRVLDVGCGTGLNLEHYAGLGDVAGIDPAAEAVEFCRRRGFEDVAQAPATDLPFGDASFGLVTATDVIEHVRDDEGALAEMHRVAAPGATLLLTVPAYQWMWSDEDRRLGHQRRYLRDQLEQRCRAAGWHPLFGTYFNLVLLPVIAAARKLPLRRGTDSKAELALTPGLLNGPLSVPMRAEARLIRAGVSLPAGVSIGLICERRA